MPKSHYQVSGQIGQMRENSAAINTNAITTNPCSLPFSSLVSLPDPSTNFLIHNPITDTSVSWY